MSRFNWILNLPTFYYLFAVLRFIQVILFETIQCFIANLKGMKKIFYLQTLVLINERKMKGFVAFFTDSATFLYPHFST